MPTTIVTMWNFHHETTGQAFYGKSLVNLEQIATKKHLCCFILMNTSSITSDLKGSDKGKHHWNLTPPKNGIFPISAFYEHVKTSLKVSVNCEIQIFIETVVASSSGLKD